MRILFHKIRYVRPPPVQLMDTCDEMRVAGGRGRGDEDGCKMKEEKVRVASRSW